MTSPGRMLHVVRTPDRPGPGPMPEAALRALDLTVQRRVEGLLSGDYRTTVPGIGTELSRVRPYEPGDDVRRLEWNVTARTGIPHVSVHMAERALTTWLVLDTSPSMNFGTADRRKFDTAEGVSLAIGHIATRRANRLGVVSFGGPKLETLPPRQGRNGLFGLLLGLRKDARPDGETGVGLGTALAYTASIARQHGIVVIVSDFRGARDWEKPLLRLAGHHAVLGIEVRDPREQELPDVGEIHLVDPETGRSLRVDTADRDLRERFADAAAAEREEVAAMFRRVGASHAVVSTGGDWLRTLAGFLRSQGRVA
ncbi:MAG: DUF58 domain-containing protein [Dehalococcoidia bacterium]|nr:DUF58 domain-containing protein [Dehalococcoidia bacterium]